jgi:outer membrane biosynthesis protein TonB
MKRITTLLMGAGALALAACSAGGDGGNDAAANVADENAGAEVMFDQSNGIGNVAETAPAAADGNSAASTPAETSAAPAAPAPATPRPKTAPKAAPEPRTQPKQVAPRPAPKAETPPLPPETECTPEHRAAGHC